MPNWCFNTLRVSGDQEQIDRLRWTEPKSLLLQFLIPYPENLTPEKGYQWALTHWGVKWDCSVEVVDCTNGYLELQFNTPWTSPFEGIDTIASMFRDLSFDMRSSESGNDWRSYSYWEDGELVEDIKGTYYRQTPDICPECHEEYYPEIDLDGSITYSECFQCGWSEETSS